MNLKLIIHKLFGLHKWEKIGPSLPIKSDNEFNNSCTMMALGKCKICGKLELREAFGSFQYCNYNKVTKKEYMEKHKDDN